MVTDDLQSPIHSWDYAGDGEQMIRHVEDARQTVAGAEDVGRG